MEKSFNEFLKRKKIYLDMDGVLCDFNKNFREISDGENFTDYSNKYGFAKSWKMIENLGIEFWRDMDWNEGGEKLWDFLKNFDNLEILTGSPYGKVGEYAKKGKEIWIKNNIGDIKVNHIVGKLKYTYVKNEDILIDDSKRNCDLWDKVGGISILHKNTYTTIEKLKNLIKY